MHNGHKIYRVLCQVTDTKGYFILGREQAQQMNYIQHPEIQPPICTLTPETSLKTIDVENNKRSSSQIQKDGPRQMNEKQPKNMSKLHTAGFIEPIVPNIKWRDNEK